MFKINSDVKNILEEQIKASGLCVVGEVHGVKENATFYRYLITTFNFNCIALEWPKRYESKLNAYFNNPKEIEKVFSNTDKDGRLYVELLDILKEFTDCKKIEKIIYFDTYNLSERSTSDWNKRDGSMAKELIQNLSSGLRTLVIAGNLHANKIPFIDKEFKEKRFPFSYHLQKELGDFPLITIRYLSGSYYNFGKHGFCESSDLIPGEILSTGKYEYKVGIKKATAVDLL